MASITLEHGQAITVSGATYQFSDQLKRIGLKFDGARKVWTGSVIVADNNRHARSNIQSAIGAGKLRLGSAAPSHGPCRKCGTYCYGDCEV